MIQHVRYIIFLRDVLKLALTSFGGPQAHLAYFQRTLVEQRKYLTEEELMELNSLCQILPGPSSTQTLTAIGYRLGGPNLAYLTLLVWSLPSVLVMTAAGIFLSSIQEKNWSLAFTRFIQPMAVGFVSYAAWSICLKTLHSRVGVIIMVASAIVSVLLHSPFVFPVILLIAGLVTALNYRKHPRQEKKKIAVNWSNFLLWIGVLVAAALIGAVTRWLPIRLFENFYRNGSLIFGGGQVLIPLLYTEFVQYGPKQYLTPQEFLTGYAFAQSLPGPVFSFSAYIGALAMRDFGIAGELTGALLSAAGIFLPGTFLIFFVIRFWDSLKTFRPVRASLEGITAASTGLVVGAAVMLFQPLPNNFTSWGLAVGTFALLAFTRIPHPLIILGGLVLGLALK